MGFPEHYLNKLLGTKEPDLSGLGLKVGDWLVYCGHCGYQHKPLTAINGTACPECRKPMTMGYVTVNDIQQFVYKPKTA